MTGENMNPDLVEEIDFMIDILTKSGFFDTDEILEILEDEFIEEDVDFSQFNLSLNEFDNNNFNKLEAAFSSLVAENIVAVHNCGYDIEEGVQDAFELFVHLMNNNFKPEGFCFYSFEDIEEAITDKKLKITFGDFENNEDKALEIGKTVSNYLKSEGFSINWDETINNQIEILSFDWDKSYDNQKVFEIEGAYDNFVKGVLK